MENENIRLALPGAGLPIFERLTLQYIAFPLLTKLMSDSLATSMFNREGKNIVSLTKKLSSSGLRQKVLVPRISGMEDSSRYWSVGMTLVHLMLVGGTILEIVSILNDGEIPNFKVSIEDVKPSEEIPENIVNQFSNFLKVYEENLRFILDKKREDSLVRHRHPWFGLLTAHQWLVLSSVHQRIHRIQIKNIIKGLAKT
jgi:hypothetical protein